MKSICKEYVDQHWPKERKWLVLLMLVLVGLTLCTVVVLTEDKFPSPVHAIQKCLHALWWSVVALTRTAVTVLTYLFKGMFLPWKGLTYGGGKLTHVIPQPSTRDLVKPLKFTKGQIKHLHPFNVIEKMFSASKGVAKASGNVVKMSVLYIWKGNVASWRLFLRCGKALAKPGRFLIKGEKSFVSATKKDFIIPFRFSKKLGKQTASAGKKGVKLPWRFSKTLGKETASAGKKGVKLPWRFSKTLGKETASAGKKGVKLPWRFSKTLGKETASAGKKGVKLPWRFSKTLGKETASAGKKGVVSSWRFSEKHGAATVSATKKGFRMPRRFSIKHGKLTVPAGKKAIVISRRFSKKHGRKTASVIKIGPYTLLSRRQKKAAEQKTSSFIMKCLFPLRMLLRWTAKPAVHEHALPVILMQAALGIFNGLVTLGVLFQYFLSQI